MFFLLPTNVGTDERHNSVNYITEGLHGVHGSSTVSVSDGHKGADKR